MGVTVGQTKLEYEGGGRGVTSPHSSRHPPKSAHTTTGSFPPSAAWGTVAPVDGRFSTPTAEVEFGN